MDLHDTAELALAQIEAALAEQDAALEAAFTRARTWPETELVVDASALEEIADATRARVATTNSNGTCRLLRC